MLWTSRTWALVLLAGGIVVISMAHRNPTTTETPNETIEDGQILDQEPDYVEPTENLYPTPYPIQEETYEEVQSPCCGSPGHLDNLHYLIVATMDGTIRALDIERSAAIAWEGNFDAQPLMAGTLGRVQPMVSEGREYTLVPALDGSLYMYSLNERILEPIPLNTDAMLQASLKIGSEAVAGGKTVSTTGVDPVTGKVRYHCNLANCEKFSEEDAHATLVFKRSGHMIRAMDGFTGSERWNLSVAEYEANLLIKEQSTMRGTIKTPFSFRVSPPEGIITASDSCGEKWTITVGSHVAHMWEMRNSEIREVSLFESRNIHTLSAEDELAQRRQVPMVESQSLLYLGTCNSQPFIIHSPLLKRESMKLAGRSTRDNFDGRRDRNLLPALRSTYMLEPTTLVDMLTNSYKNSITREVEANEDYHKQVAIRGPRDVQASKDVSQTKTSCHTGDSIAMIGQNDIRSAKFPVIDDEVITEDDGYFVMRQSSPRRSWFPRDGDSQCHGFVPRLRRHLRLDETVSGWWRAVAILITLLLGTLAYPLFKYSRRLREARRQLTIDSPRTSTESYGEAENNTEEAKVIANRSLSTLTEKSSTATLVQQPSFCEAPFESKFLQDFEVIRVLGKGGYGVVFSARNKMDDIDYAVKRIAVSQDQRAIDRVSREVKTMARFDHPGIIRYYHSWMEKPPPEWQEENDKQLLKALKHQRMRHKNGEESHTTDHSLSFPTAVGLSQKSSIADCPEDPQPSKEFNSVESLEFLLNKNKTFARRIEEPPADPDPREDSSGSGSWLDDGDDGTDRASSSSDSSDDEESSEDRPNKTFDAKEMLREDSDSIIFNETSRLSVNRIRQQSTKSTSSQEASRIEPPAIIITSHNNDLLPSKDAKVKCHAYVYIQMQLCQSMTLSDWLKTHSTAEDRSLSRMRSWFIQLVEATEYIHNQGLIHRDIKPQNIFFAQNDVLKIGDMGLISKSVSIEDDYDSSSSGGDNIHTGDVGTKSYMSPEQLAHRPYTNKVDVFSLGVVFVEMVLPFSTVMERLTTLAQLQKGRVPKELDAFPKEKLFASLLCAKDPSQRPTCSEILSNPYLLDGVIDRKRHSSLRNSQNSID